MMTKPANATEGASRPANPTGRVKSQAKISDPTQSALKKYQTIVVGSTDLSFTLKYELLTMLFGSVGGAAGFWFRKTFWRSLFRNVGRGVVFGRNVVIRHPKKISLGDGVVVSDGCVLDAAGDGNAGIKIESNVILGQSAMLRCKNGDIHIGRDSGIGANTAIYAVDGNRINIGSDALIAPFVYIGGGQYHYDRTDIPISKQGTDPRGGNQIGNGCWLGARVTVIDGVDIGHDTIVSAGSVLLNSVPGLAIVGGHPARVLRNRQSD
jgi:acetyltransferase-like isoleucine patch superfamily enzyme